MKKWPFTKDAPIKYIKNLIINHDEKLKRNKKHLLGSVFYDFFIK